MAASMAATPLRVHLRTDDRIRPSQIPRPGHQIALTVVRLLRHHCTVQPEDHSVHRQCGGQLPQQLIAQVLCDHLSAVNS